jgi:hypothetical protein
MKKMREYSDSVKRNFVLMMNSPDWGRRFYDEHARPFFYSMINNMVETSEYSLDKLTIKEDNSTRWLAYFHHDPKTDEKFFAFNKEKILDGKSTALNGKDADSKRQLDAIFQLMITCCHEFRHYEQLHMEKEKKVKELEPYALMFAKEEVIKRVDYNFYKTHHDSFLSEIEATTNALIEIKNFLTNLGKTNKRIEKIIEGCDSYLAKEQKKMFEYTKANGFGETISAKFDEIIKRLPPEKRKAYLDEMPSLTLVCDQNGNKRSYHDLMKIKYDIQTKNKNELSQLVSVNGKPNTFSYKIERIFYIAISCDKVLRKQRDDDYHKKEIKLDEYGVPLQDIENEKKKMSQSKGISHSR